MSRAFLAGQGPFPTPPPSLNEGTYAPMNHTTIAPILLIYFSHTVLAGQGPFPTRPG